MTAGLSPSQITLEELLNEKTLRRRLEEGEYRKRIHEMQEASLSRANRVLSSGVEKAALTLVELLSSESDAVRIRAGVALLDRMSLLGSFADTGWGTQN